jgi:hypothetical protein
MITMGVSLASGKPIWRKFPCTTSGRVAYIGIEYYRDHVLDMFCRAGEALSLDLDQLFKDVTIHTVGKSVVVETDKLVEHLRTLAKAHVAVFVDDAYAIVDKKDWPRFVEAVTALSRDTQTPVILSKRTRNNELDKALNVPDPKLYEGTGAVFSFCQVRGEYKHRRVILVNQPEVYHGSFPAIDGVLSFDAPPEPASLAPPRPLCATFVQIPVERRELVRAEASIENPSLKALN